MRSRSLPQAESAQDAGPRPGRQMYRRIGLLRAAWVGLLAAPLLLPGAFAGAQNNPNPAPAAAVAPTPKHVQTHKKLLPTTPAPQPAPPPAPVAPPSPDWPANDLPVAASVVFDSRGLLVVASNSSLAQILKEVSTEAGIKVEGMDTDQRIFGAYGPGPARDVISELLDGSGYDVLMIGDRGEGTPRQIVLTMRSGSAVRNTANNTPPPPANEETDADQPAPEPEAEQPPTQPPQNGTAPPVPARTPQQILEEIQDRQRQQQSGQQNPQN